MEAESVQPDFGIFERFGDIAPGEGFVARGIAVSLEALVDVGLFTLCQELGGFRIVIHPAVCCGGHEDGQNPLLFDMSICIQTCEAWRSAPG